VRREEVIVEKIDQDAAVAAELGIETQNALADYRMRIRIAVDLEVALGTGAIVTPERLPGGNRGQIWQQVADAKLR